DDASIDWTADGNIAYVDIEFNNGSSWIDVTDPATGIASGEGDKSFSVGSWHVFGEIPDARTNIAQIKITDHSNSSVTATSATFWCYPDILTAAVTVTPQIAETKPTVTWTYPTTIKMTKVDILLDPNGDGDLADAVTLENDVNVDASPHQTAASFPVDIRDNAKIRVRDNTSLFAGKAKEDTGGFKIIGEITLDLPVGTTEWICGDTEDAVVDWSYKGAINNVKIYQSTDGSDPTNWLATVPASDSKWTWTAGVTNTATNQAKIKVESEDKPSDTVIVSDTFDFIGGFVFTNVDNQVICVERDSSEFMNIKWTATGGGVTKARLEYTPTGLEANYTLISDDIDNTFTDGQTLNSYDWTTIPHNIASPYMKLRISPSNPNQPDNTYESGSFSLLGNIFIDEPDGVGDIWVTDGETANTIRWEIEGIVDDVKILYAQNGTDFNETVVSQTDADNELAGQYGTYEWTIPTDVTKELLSTGGRIKVQDFVAAYATSVNSTSGPFTIKGLLDITEPSVAQMNAGFTAGASQQITFTRQGKVDTAYVMYSRSNAGSFQYTIDTVNFTPGAASANADWTIPEYVGHQNDSNGYAIRVKDTNNANTKADSQVFTVSGELSVTNNNSTWDIGSTRTITWDIKHGNIGLVNLIGSRSGTFAGVNDTFLITAQPTDADNVTLFDPDGYGTYVGQGSYSWDPVTEYTPSIISSVVKIKVADSDSDYDVSNESSADFNITGGFSVDKPALDWNVGDNTSDITWTTYGNVANVHIDFYDGSTQTWIDVTDPAIGVACGAGNKSFSVGNWLTYNEIPDVKSDNCKLRVTDLADENVSNQSNTFWTYPLINSVTVTATPDDQQGATYKVWRAGVSNQSVSWNETSSKLSSVDIHLILDGSTDITLKEDATSTTDGDNSYSTISLPGTLKMSNNAIVRVMDNNSTFASKLQTDSATFWVLGKLSFGASPASGADWFIGDTNKTVTWTAYGEQMTSVDISIDYDDGDGYQYVKTESTTPGSSDSWEFDDPNSQIEGVGDHVTETAKIMIEDSDTSSWRQPYTQYESPAFNIVGSFADVIANPASGDADVVAGKAGATITWTKTGSAISHVELHYSTNGTAWNLLVDGIDDDGQGGFEDLLVVNNELYNWTPPADSISDTSYVRVRDPDNSSAATKTSGKFTIASKVVCDLPDTDSDWYVDDTGLITWTKYGDFDNVKIYYSASNGQDGTWDEIDSAVTKDSDNVDADHGSYQWFIPSATTTLSANGRIKVIAKQNESYALATMSEAFEVRGILTLVRPDSQTYPATDSVYRVYDASKANPCPIDWDITGNIDDVVVQYSKNGTSWTTIQTVSSPTTNLDWEVPGTDTGIIGTNRYVRVYDADNTDNISQSNTFEVKGDITLDYPVGAPIGTEEFIVGVTETILWTPKGNFPSGYVVIEGSSDNFAGGGDTYTIVSKSAGSHNVQQEHPWNVYDVASGDLVVSTNTKIRIRDLDDSEVIDTSGKFTIRGSLNITTPSTVWYVNDDDKSISWGYDGPIAKVDLHITDSTGVGWIQLTPDGGINCATEYYTGFTVPDAINNNAKLRIRDADPTMGSDVYDISNTFFVRGRIRFKYTTPYDKPDQGQIFFVGAEGAADNSIEWETDGTIPYIRIDFSKNDGETFPINLEPGWDSTQVWHWDPVDDEITKDGKFRISNKDDVDNTNAESCKVTVAGVITLTTDDPTYNYDSPIYVNDPFIIKWTKVGSDLDFVDMFYSVNNGVDSYPYQINTDPVNADLLQFTWYPDPTKPLHPSADNGGQCKIKIIDRDITASVSYSETFYLTGKMAWDDTNGFDDPADGIVQIVGDNLELEWETTGDSVTNVRIDYSLTPNQPPTSWISTPLEVSIPNTGYYNWYIAPTIPNIISTFARVRITDVYDDNCELLSGITQQNTYYFKIRGYLGVTSPAGTESWIVDTTHDVTWDVKGPVADVNIFYTYDTSDPIQINQAPIPSNQGSTGFEWTIPPTTDKECRIKVVSTGDSTTYAWSNTFTIRGGFTWNYPVVEDDVFYIGTQETLSWNTFGNIDNVDVRYSTNNGFSYGTNFCKNLAGAEADDISNTTESFVWKVPDAISTQAFVKVEDSLDGDAAKATKRIKIADTIYSDVALTPEEKRWPVGTSKTIQWHTDGSLGDVKLEYTTNADAQTPTWETIEETWQADADKTWPIPGSVPLTSFARIRISDVITDSGTVPVMSSTFKFVGNLNINSPDANNIGANAWTVVEGGEISSIQPEVIEWSTDGTVDDVNLYYRVYNSVGQQWGTWITIDGPVSNINKYTWDVVDAVATQVQVMVEHEQDKETYAISDTFQIHAALEITSPLGHATPALCEKWPVDSQQEITWLRNGTTLSTVFLWYSDNYGSGWKPIGEVSNNGSSYWDVEDVNLPSGAKEQAKIKITDTQVAPLISTQSPNNFKIMANIDVTDPEGGGDIVMAGQGYTIKWNDGTGSFVANGSLCTDVRIELALDGDEASPNYSETIKLTTSHDGSYSWPVSVEHVTPNAKIRIYDVNDFDSVNASSSPFIIRAAFVMLEPSVDGENLEVGQDYDVIWSKTGNIPEVLLQYTPLPLGGNGNFQTGDIRDIEGSTNGLVPNEDVDDQGQVQDPTQGRFTWRVPDIEDNKDVNLHLRVMDPNDEDAYAISVTFNIIPKFEVTTPSGNENPKLEWKVGDPSYNIVWTSSSDIAKTPKVDLFYGDFEFGGGIYQKIADDTDNDGSYSWQTGNGGPPDVISTQMKIKVVDSSDDVANDPSDDYFSVISNMSMDFPDGNATYVVGDSIDIQWSKEGTVNNLEFAYSTASDDFSDPAIFEISAATNGADSGVYSWTVPDAISYNVRFRVASTTDNGEDISDADFRIKGKIEFNENTAPQESEHVKIGTDYEIKWKSTGTIPNVDIYYDTNGGLGADNQPNTGDEFLKEIADNEPNLDTFTWENVPDDASPTTKIKITDSRTSPDNSDVFAITDTFNIAGTFTITSPAEDDDWRVETPHDIIWEWGGTMPYVKLTYSISTYDSDLEQWVQGDYNPIFTTSTDTNNNGLDDDDGVVANGTYNPLITNTLSYEWTIPDAISPTVIMRIEDDNDSTVKDESDPFLIRGSFVLTTPNGGERWVTNEIRKVEWSTTGTISTVKLEYSNDDFVADIHTIAETLNTGSYNWTVPDAVTKDILDNYAAANPVKLRVVDAGDPGVSDDSAETFDIDYYKVTWNIVDLITNQPIDSLTVNCDSGWSTSGISSGITHPTPAGFWSAEWSHPDYGPITESYLLGWDSDKGIWRGDTIIYRTMETLIVHIWRAYSEFSYEVDDDRLDITSWLERDGSLVTGALLIDVKIYDGEYTIKRKSILVDNSANKFYYYLDIVDSDTDPVNGVKMWLGSRLNNNGTPDDPSDDYEELRDIYNVIADAAAYKVSERTQPADSGGFYQQVWSPTDHTSGSNTYDTLQSGKVYTVITYMAVSTGAIFRTPVSFTVTDPIAMDDMTEQVKGIKDQVADTLDKPLSQVSSELNAALAVQATTITTKMNEQKEIIEEATEEMKDAVNESLTSFEETANEALTTLQSGADRAVEAGEALQETAEKYSWAASASPNPVLTGEDVTITVQGPPGKVPILDIYAWDGSLITGGIVLTDITQPGLYYYDLTVDANFKSGKAFSYIASEQTTGGLVSGSVMVESMSITAIAGLAAAAPGAERAAKKALTAIKAVESVLISGDSINIALTLKNLRDAVDELPEILSKEGPSATLNRTLNDISEKIKQLAGDEGYDFSDILEEALKESPTMKEVRNKTEAIGTVIDILLALFESKFGGMDIPVVSTDMQSGSVIFRVIAVNPSKFRTQNVQVKKYLPQETSPEDIVDSGGLAIEYDVEKSLYFAFMPKLELAPQEVRTFEIEINDIWILPDPKLADLEGQTDAILRELEDTSYYLEAKLIADTIYPRVNEVRTSQFDESVSRQRHIGVYRQNLIVVDEIKEDIEKLEKILATAGAPPQPSMLETPDIKADSPSMAMTWIVIFIIVIFLGLLAMVLFFTWHKQASVASEAILESKKEAFPSQGSDSSEKEPGSEEGVDS
ncbi:hypothetical protein ACFL0T_06260, partial [Candidatus Omnitrophota bacterium]